MNLKYQFIFCCLLLLAGSCDNRALKLLPKVDFNFNLNPERVDIVTNESVNLDINIVKDVNDPITLNFSATIQGGEGFIKINDLTVTGNREFNELDDVAYIPTKLGTGVHVVKITLTDNYGESITESIQFNVFEDFVPYSFDFTVDAESDVVSNQKEQIILVSVNSDDSRIAQADLMLSVTGLSKGIINFNNSPLMEPVPIVTDNYELTYIPDPETTGEDNFTVVITDKNNQTVGKGFTITTREPISPTVITVIIDPLTNNCGAINTDDDGDNFRDCDIIFNIRSTVQPGEGFELTHMEIRAISLITGGLETITQNYENDFNYDNGKARFTKKQTSPGTFSCFVTNPFNQIEFEQNTFTEFTFYNSDGGKVTTEVKIPLFATSTDCPL